LVALMGHAASAVAQTARPDQAEAAPSPRTAAPDATEAAPEAEGAPTLPVDWPDLPPATELALVTTAGRLRVRTETDAPLLVAEARRWGPEGEALLALQEARLGLELPFETLDLVFASTYPGRCPARGLASPAEASPTLAIFIDETTTDVQIRGVLAHELVHAITMRETFVGDGVLTEGIANWGGGEFMLAWQGFASWEDAVRSYLAEGSYLSVADEEAMVPAPGEDCLARRDRVYNARASFTGWLIGRVGLTTVLAMPARRVEGRRDAYEPDYEAATGFTLEELETVWLADTSGAL
jgi:hypothetical protein